MIIKKIIIIILISSIRLNLIDILIVYKTTYSYQKPFALRN